MKSTLDTNLSKKYIKMVGLNNIINDSSNNSYLNNSLTVNSNLFISNLSLLGLISINSNLNINSSCILNNISINNTLNISGLAIFNSNVTLNNIIAISNLNINNLYISGYSIFNNNVSNNSSMYVSGISNFNNVLFTNNINSSILNINASNINIGSDQSNVFINGTSTYIASSETILDEKCIILNINSTSLQGTDIGILSGIQIMGISSFGFLRTTVDANRYQIKSPLIGSSINYITTQDLNNNLNISGTSILLGSSSINSSLNLNSLSIINNSFTIGNNLFINGSIINNSSIKINNSLNISGSTIINNFTSLNSSLNISGFTIINSQVSIYSSLYNMQGTVLNNYVSINNSLNIINNILIKNNTSLNSSLNISGLTNISNASSFNSSLNLSGSNNIIGSLSIKSNLFVSGFTIINNSISINSRLSISGSTILNNSITINSIFQILGQIVSTLPNYDYNIDAKNAGIPIWGWYRTGGILKIRLNDIPPTLYLSGSTQLNINVGASLTDPGILALDNANNSIPVYLSSITNVNNYNYVNNNILISGYSTLITQTSLLLIGSYTATYQAQDYIGNLGFIYRNININNPLTPYNSSIIQVSYRQSNSYIINPVFQSSPNLWYWTPPYNTQGFGGSGESFALSSQYLNSIGFKYNSSWCFVLKCQRTYVSENWLDIEFDSNQSDWRSNSGAGQGGGSKQLSINSSNITGTGFPTVTYTGNNLFNIGIYINISFNYINSTSTDNGYLKVECNDLTGNLLFTNISSSLMQYSNRKIPFHIYQNIDTYQFLTGVYYNNTGYVNYSTFSKFL